MELSYQLMLQIVITETFLIEASSVLCRTLSDLVAALNRQSSKAQKRPSINSHLDKRDKRTAPVAIIPGPTVFVHAQHSGTGGPCSWSMVYYMFFVAWKKKVLNPAGSYVV